jgi:hypothetical protein
MVVLMIPVVMLGINTGVLSFHFLTVFGLTVPCPSFEHIPVIYLTTVVLRAMLVTDKEGVHMSLDLGSMIECTHLTYQTLSLLINIFATSLIAFNAWCICVNGVFGKYLVVHALIDDIKEIPQVVDETRIGCPDPYTGSKDTEPPGRVRYDLYSDWRKFLLGIHAWVFTNYTFSSGHELGFACHSPALPTCSA